MGKFLTREEFIERSKSIHGDKYDYSPVQYDRSDKKVKLICPIHGVFEQRPHNHLKGQTCPKCSDGILTKEDFFNKCEIIHHNKYDYSLSDYENGRSIIKIICPIHGMFEQIARVHFKGHGCPKCNGGVLSNKEDFIRKSIDIHKTKYDYSLVDYINAHRKVQIICKKHGVFEQSPNKHLLGHGCSKCSDSKGESRVKEILDDKNIKYEIQKTFIGCKYKSLLKFDFYLPEYNTCIEFDGEQHETMYRFEKDDKRLKIRMMRDKLKTEYCQNNDIKLIRIKHNDSIEDKLSIIL